MKTELANEITKTEWFCSIFRVPAMWSRWHSMERTHHSAFMTSGFQMKSFISRRGRWNQSLNYTHISSVNGTKRTCLCGDCDLVLFALRVLWNTKLGSTIWLNTGSNGQVILHIIASWQVKYTKKMIFKLHQKVTELYAYILYS